jgi:hypothetical protein
VHGAYRLSVRVSPAEFTRRFGRPFRYLRASERPDPAFDYRAGDRICPDPAGWWVALSVLNPSEATFEALKPTIQEAYGFCRAEWPLALARRLHARHGAASVPPVGEP